MFDSCKDRAHMALFKRAGKKRRMTVSAHDVARELRSRRPDLDALQVEKLLYLAQGWHLVWVSDRLFEESIQAWLRGPVVAGFWADEKHDRGRPPERPLPPEGIATVNYVIERYGHMSGPELARLSHQQGPWRDLSLSLDTSWGASPEITDEALIEWFSQDEEYQALKAEAQRLKQRRNIYTFAPRPRTPFINEAVARARAGKRVQANRPG